MGLWERFQGEGHGLMNQFREGNSMHTGQRGRYSIENLKIVQSSISPGQKVQVVCARSLFPETETARW